VGERGLAVDGEDDSFEFFDFGIVDKSLLLEDEGCQRFGIFGKLIFAFQHKRNDGGLQ